MSKKGNKDFDERILLLTGGFIVGVGCGLYVYEKVEAAKNKSSLDDMSSSAGNGTSVSDALCAGLFGRR